MQKNIIKYIIIGCWMLLIFFGIIAKTNPELVSKIPRQKQNRISETISKADIDILNKRYDDATQKYMGVLKTNPNNIGAIIKLSTLYQNIGFADKAISLLNNSLKNPKFPYLIYQELAHIYSVNKNPNKAIYYYNKSLETEPFAINTCLDLSQLYKNTQQWDKLISILQNAAKKRTNPGYFYSGALKQSLFTYRNSEELQQIIQSKINERIDKKELHKFDINIFYDCLKNDKELAIIFNKIAFGYAAMNNNNEAISYFKRALKVWPEYMEARHNLNYLQTQIERQTKK
ncbi:MAG: hypothetical protein KAG95_05185 [Bacteroidales bacterium]|nr:hypothetical protein [Bacteroidales bacterium]